MGLNETIFLVYFIVLIVLKSSCTEQYIPVFRAIIPKTNSNNLTYLKQLHKNTGFSSERKRILTIDLLHNRKHLKIHTIVVTK